MNIGQITSFHEFGIVNVSTEKVTYSVPFIKLYLYWCIMGYHLRGSNLAVGILGGKERECGENI